MVDKYIQGLIDREHADSSVKYQRTDNTETKGKTLEYDSREIK